MTESTSLRTFVATRIKELRTEQGLSQEALSNMANLEPKYVNKLEVGKTNSTIDTLDELIKALGIDYPTFFKDFQFPTASKELNDLLRLLGSMDDTTQQNVIAAITVLIEAQKNDSDHQ